MMSNSRLAEQIHGMIRHNLRSQIGMDQADHQRQYAAHDYEMREPRRIVSDMAGDGRETKKRAMQHEKTKEQKLILSGQVLDGSYNFADMVRSELAPDDIVGSVSKWRDAGRRK